MNVVTNECEMSCESVGRRLEAAEEGESGCSLVETADYLARRPNLTARMDDTLRSHFCAIGRAFKSAATGGLSSPPVTFRRALQSSLTQCQITELSRFCS